MEYVDGCNLAEWIAVHAPRLTEETRTRVGLYIALEVVEAIHTAHKLGILHRDIKPQNVLCSARGRVKVADFGLARVVEAITRTHTMWGRHTPLYAAPEQWEDRKPDERTDVYQLCATLYHLLAGRPANEGQNLIGLMRWQQAGTLKPLVGEVPVLPTSVGRLIEEGLANDPEDRPALWALFDAISDSLMVKLEMSIDARECDKDTIQEIADLTDFSQEKLLDARQRSETTFPNALEALREAVGVTLLGGRPELTVVGNVS